MGTAERLAPKIFIKEGVLSRYSAWPGVVILIQNTKKPKANTITMGAN